MLDDRELTLRRRLGMAEASFSQVTSATGRLRCFETGNAIAAEEHVLAGAVELMPCGTDATRVCFVVDEGVDSEQFRLGVFARFALALATQASLLLVARLVSRHFCKRCFAFAVVSIRDVCVSASCLHSRHHHVAVKATIGGHLHVSEDVLL